MKQEQSKQMYERARQSIPSGVNSNSRYSAPHPIYFRSADGATLRDLDGNSYVDLVMGNGSIILGHNYRPFREKLAAVTREFDTITNGVETELTVLAAEQFLKLVPAERVRFSTTGTEAMLHVMNMARALTGKNDFAKIEGSYHGWMDHANVSTFPGADQVGDYRRPNPVPGDGGVDKKVAADTVVVPFNDLAVAEEILTPVKDRIAALLVEPVMIDVGYIRPAEGYLRGLRRLCDDLGILLVFDELLTGFRVPEGSCQKQYGVTPDLSIFGKALANGYILSAVAGTEEAMAGGAVGGPTTFVGTFNGHQVSLAASLATLELLADGGVRAALQEGTDRLQAQFAASAAKYQVPAFFDGEGGHFHFYFAPGVAQYRDAITGDSARFLAFAQHLEDKGYFLMKKPLSHHAISYAHLEGDTMDRLLKDIDLAMKAAALAR